MAAHGPEQPRHVTQQPRDSVSPGAGEEDPSAAGWLGELGRRAQVHRPRLCGLPGLLRLPSEWEASLPPLRAQLGEWEHLGQHDGGRKGNRILRWARGCTLIMGGWRVEASHLDTPVRPFHENVPPCAHPAGLPAAGLHLPNPQDSRGTSLETGGCPLSGLGCLELTSGGDMPAACSLSQSPSCNLSYSPSSGWTPLRLLFPFRPW